MCRVKKQKESKNESYFPGVTSTNMFPEWKLSIPRKELADLNREALSAKKACGPQDIWNIWDPGAGTFLEEQHWHVS